MQDVHVSHLAYMWLKASITLNCKPNIDSNNIQSARTPWIHHEQKSWCTVPCHSRLIPKIPKSLRSKGCVGHWSNENLLGSVLVWPTKPFYSDPIFMLLCSVNKLYLDLQEHGLSPLVVIPHLRINPVSGSEITFCTPMLNSQVVCLDGDNS